MHQNKMCAYTTMHRLKISFLCISYMFLIDLEVQELQFLHVSFQRKKMEDVSILVHFILKTKYILRNKYILGLFMFHLNLSITLNVLPRVTPYVYSSKFDIQNASFTRLKRYISTSVRLATLNGVCLIHGTPPAG